MLPGRSLSWIISAGILGVTASSTIFMYRLVNNSESCIDIAFITTAVMAKENRHKRSHECGGKVSRSSKRLETGWIWGAGPCHHLVAKLGTAQRTYKVHLLYGLQNGHFWASLYIKKLHFCDFKSCCPHFKLFPIISIIGQESQKRRKWGWIMH